MDCKNFVNNKQRRWYPCTSYKDCCKEKKDYAVVHNFSSFLHYTPLINWHMEVNENVTWWRQMSKARREKNGGAWTYYWLIEINFFAMPIFFALAIHLGIWIHSVLQVKYFDWLGFGSSESLAPQCTYEAYKIFPFITQLSTNGRSCVRYVCVLWSKVSLTNILHIHLPKSIRQPM